MKSLPVYLGLATLLWGAIAGANQPLPPKIQINPEIEGQTLILQLINQEKFGTVVEIQAGELSSLNFQSTRIKMAPGQKLSQKFELRGELRGRQALHLTTRVLGEKEVGLLAGPTVYQAFLLNGQAAKKLSYEEAFLRQREEIKGPSKKAEIDLGGAIYASEIGRLAFKAKQMPSDGKIEPYRARDAREYSKLQLRQLPRDPNLAGGRPGTPNGVSNESEAIDSPLDSNAVSSEAVSENDTSSEDPLNQPFWDASATVIKGRMSLKTAPSTYKAAWGWVVRAWQNIGGIWIFQGWTYVGGDGAWQISLAAPIPGVQVRVEYLTKNRFVSIQDASGNPYHWGDNWSLTGGITDIGSRYADLTVNGDLPAVDKLYVGATNIWVKFYNLGMNALRDQPIQIFFPNTMASGQCIYNDGAGPYAWSCSYSADGRIYIIPAHGSASVVQHEIGHSINSFYWGGKMPPGSGGTHNLWNCYNNGLALSEGFANFLTYWTQFERNTAAPMAPYFNMNLEAIPAGVCANQTAEMRVAAAFWDMYDSTAENVSSTVGDDLYFVNQGYPVAMYLGNKRDAMSDYLAVSQSGQNAFWQNEFKRLFRLNKIIP